MQLGIIFKKSFFSDNFFFRIRIVHGLQMLREKNSHTKVEEPLSSKPIRVSANVIDTRIIPTLPLHVIVWDENKMIFYSIVKQNSCP